MNCSCPSFLIWRIVDSWTPPLTRLCCNGCENQSVIHPTYDLLIPLPTLPAFWTFSSYLVQLCGHRLQSRYVSSCVRKGIIVDAWHIGSAQIAISAASSSHNSLKRRLTYSDTDSQNSPDLVAQTSPIPIRSHGESSNLRRVLLWLIVFAACLWVWPHSPLEPPIRFPRASCSFTNTLDIQSLCQPGLRLQVQRTEARSRRSQIHHLQDLR